MNEERMKILEMLSEGNISIDEAMQLLDSMERFVHPYAARQERPKQDWDFDRQRKFRNENGPSRRGRNPNIYRDADDDLNIDIDLGWVNELKDNLTESVQSVANQLDNGFDFGRPTMVFNDTAENVPDEISSINLKGKNAKLEVIATEDNNISLEAFFKPKHNMDPHIFFEKSNGNYSLLYDRNAVHSMGIRLRVPNNKIKDLYVETKNSDIYLRGLNINTGDVLTKNSSIQVDNMNGSYLSLETKNAPIYVNNTNFSELEVKTSNAKAILDTLNCGNLTVQTTNGSVKIDSSDIRYILAKATNAGIRLENMANGSSGQYQKYSVDLFTINSNISVNYPGCSAPLKLNASTTSGRINCKREDLEYKTLDKNYIDAISKDYDDAHQTLDIKAQTTNGNISIDV